MYYVVFRKAKINKIASWSIKHKLSANLTRNLDICFDQAINLACTRTSIQNIPPGPILFFFLKTNVCVWINIKVSDQCWCCRDFWGLKRTSPSLFSSCDWKKCEVLPPPRKSSRRWYNGKSLELEGLLPLWFQVRALWLLIWWSLEAYMIVNFRARGISRDVRKLTRTPRLTEKKKDWKRLPENERQWHFFYLK
jgi:hypothetical protein